eukprot:TRINITY_DN4772_c0_g2_i1.p1 TRINITY_DN4772_c0_g2~~TRINITY_DN4772_c0_g2_i1.p1  ORF type:complete len:345 (-),score=69.83 TRINITY_DN4772_c0_g2_i1:17-1051(-)
MEEHDMLVKNFVSKHMATVTDIIELLTDDNIEQTHFNGEIYKDDDQKSALEDIYHFITDGAFRSFVDYLEYEEIRIKKLSITIAQETQTHLGHLSDFRMGETWKLVKKRGNNSLYKAKSSKTSQLWKIEVALHARAARFIKVINSNWASTDWNNLFSGLFTEESKIDCEICDSEEWFIEINFNGKDTCSFPSRMVIEKLSRTNYVIMFYPRNAEHMSDEDGDILIGMYFEDAGSKTNLSMIAYISCPHILRGAYFAKVMTNVMDQIIDIFTNKIIGRGSTRDMSPSSKKKRQYFKRKSSSKEQLVKKRSSIELKIRRSSKEFPKLAGMNSSEATEDLGAIHEQK